MKQLVNVIVISILFATVFFAQDSKEKSLKQKLKDLKGSVESITIKTAEDELKLTGDEAEKIFKKFTTRKKDLWMHKFGTGDDHKVIMLDDMDEERIEIMLSNDCSIESDEDKTVKIKVDKDGDKIKVTETITENGETTENTYEDEEAEQFLKKNAKHNKLRVFSNGCDGKVFKIKMMHLGEDDDVVIEIEDDNNEKTVTVTSTKDGKEEIKTYKGKEAVDFLEKHKADNKMLLDIKEDLDGDVLIIKDAGDLNKHKIIKWKSKKSCKKIEKKIKKDIIEKEEKKEKQ